MTRQVGEYILLTLIWLTKSSLAAADLAELANIVDDLMGHRVRLCTQACVNEAQSEAGNKRKAKDANGRWEYYECWAGKLSDRNIFQEKNLKTPILSPFSFTQNAKKPRK